jgi:oligopeptide/dipeptide ABC transporter ATP-binding protein
VRAAESILRVSGLRTEFVTKDGVFAAVRDVSLELRAGEKVGIVGESGSGKSALALSILGLIEPPGRIVGGSVVLNGRQILGRPERELRRIRGREITLVFQDPMTALDPVKRIGDQIVECIRQHRGGLSRGAARREAVELLRDVDVPHADRRLDDYPHQYSGGMRQRVMIAIALANRPNVLIADEPTTALDVTTQAQVLDLLDRLVTERGTAIILITHNLGVVAEFCDSVRVMYAGRIIEQASTGRIFAGPAHPYTEALLQAVPRPDQLQQGPLQAIPGFPPSLARLPAGCSFEPRCPLGHGRELCQQQPPATTQFGVGTDAVASECHFASELVERWAKTR